MSDESEHVGTDGAIADLTAEQKLAVLGFLRSEVSAWLSLLGFASLGAVVLAFVGGGYWVFFVLPGRAVEAAKDQLQADIAAISGELTQVLTSQLQESGTNRERLRMLNEEIEATKARMLALTDTDEDTLKQAASLAALLNENPDLGQVAESLISGRIVPRDLIVVETLTSSNAAAQARHPAKRESIERDFCMLRLVQFYAGRTTACRLTRNEHRRWALEATRTETGTVACSAICFDLELE